MGKTRYRTVWISDIHLGTKGCQYELLDDFLHSIECDTLFLVGDIIDGWAMSRGSTYFPQGHVNIIRRFLNKARHSCKVCYVIGNHDEMLRKYHEFLANMNFGNIEIADEFVHITATGREIWVVHGDLWDNVVRLHKWISHAGDIGYSFLLKFNKYFNWFRRKLGLPYWSISQAIKHKVKGAVNFIDDFEQSLAFECKNRGYDGVVCGHIHKAEIRDIGGVTYYNDGDWVESCTALVEHDDGRMEIIKWHTITHNGTTNSSLH